MTQELDKLLKAAAKRIMTPVEIRDQRRSWVVGELMLSHPAMSRLQALRLVLEAEERAGDPPSASDTHRMLTGCGAIQYSDQMRCEVCNLTWDTNDSNPPVCKHPFNRTDTDAVTRYAAAVRRATDAAGNYGVSSEELRRIDPINPGFAAAAKAAGKSCNLRDGCLCIGCHHHDTCPHWGNWDDGDDEFAVAPV